MEENFLKRTTEPETTATTAESLRALSTRLVIRYRSLFRQLNEALRLTQRKVGPHDVFESVQKNFDAVQ